MIDKETLIATALTLAEGALHKLIPLNPRLQQQLQELEGKQIGIEITDKELCLLLIPCSGSLLLQRGDIQMSDAAISGDSQAFMTMLRSEDKLDLMFGKGIRVSGDLFAMRQFERLVETCRPDLEEILGNMIGDLAAHEMAQGFRSLRDQLKLMKQSVIQNTLEFLIEEKRVCLTQQENQPLKDEIYQLREQLDRLDARVNLLKKG